MASLSSLNVANSKASMSCMESWHLNASKLREKAGGVADIGIVPTAMMIALSAMEEKTVLPL